jgi:fructose-1,6-bisphosphatase/inositol monophosphatase family enzyme
MTLDEPDLRRVGEILAAAAQSEILPLFRRLESTQIRQKTSAFDVVTHADEAAEAFITRNLLSAFPGAVVVGEEAVHRDPGLLDAIATAELAFIVDPIDGTKNFVSGLPLFGVMAAATSHGRVIAGAIHDPLRGDCAYALAGGGAWLEHADGSRVDMHVAAPVPVAQMEGIVGTTFLPEPLRTQVNSRLSRLSTTTWLRCSAHEYRTIAAGHCHILFYNKLMPWDHAAGWLMHQEAGGYSAHFDGTQYLPTHTSGGLIYAPDEASWRAVRAALLED